MPDATEEYTPSQSREFGVEWFISELFAEIDTLGGSVASLNSRIDGILDSAEKEIDPAAPKSIPDTCDVARRISGAIQQIISIRKFVATTIERVAL